LFFIIKYLNIFLNIMKTINQCTKLKSLKEIEKEVYNLHKTKHRTDVNTYNLKVVNEIIYNEKSRIVAIFKDYLILDDISEFLRRFYNNTESNVRLNKVISFYEAYSRIFPNYIIIPESKYLYKNIRRKQKMIDAYNQIKAEEEENRKCVNDVIIKNKNNKKDNFFDSEIRRSILRYQPSYNLDNSYLNNRTQSIINWQDAVNDSTHTSHLNKNIIENEESILSIQNILKAMDKRNIGPLSNRLLISNKIKSSRNSLEKSKKAVGVLDDSKKILKSILSETNLKPKNMVNNIGFIINSNGNIEGYGHLQAHNIKSNNNLQNNLYFQSTPTINSKSTNLQSGSNSLRKKLEKNEKLEKTENKNINHKPVQKGEHKDILNNFTSNNPIFSLQSNGIKNLEKPSSIKVTPSSKNINNKIDIIDELVLQNQEQVRAQHISPGPEISERKLEPPSAIFKNRLATHRVSSSIPELYNTVKIINHYPSIIIPQGSTHVSINQNYYNYGNSFASPVGTRIITIENYNGSSTNTSKSKINKKKTYSESFEPQNSGLKRTKTNSNSKEVLSKSNSNFKGNPVNSHITSPTNLKIKSKESKETLVNSGSTYNSLNTNNSTVKKIKFNEGVHKNNYISIGNSQTIQIQQNTLQSLSNQQNGHVPISTQNLETNISSPKTGGKQVYSKVFKVFQENFKNISSYKSKNQKNVENLPDNNMNLAGSDVGSQNIKKENLENLIMQDDFGYLESDRQFKSRLEIRDAVIQINFLILNIYFSV
jgi:hypothetical protein